jgi:DNA/RNA endonuclease YhcR with UshA esterase domain
MAVTLTTVTMTTASDNAGMQVAAVMQETGKVTLTINANNGTVTIELDADAARKIAAELDKL